MALIDDVRISLRITSTSLDTEISDLIDACAIDLDLSGVNSTDLTDPLIKRAVILYCKANFGLGNQDTEKYNDLYEKLKNRLATSGTYKVKST